MSEPIIKIEQLVKRYKELIALDHFNLEINEGEIFGLLGPNGSGKPQPLIVSYPFLLMTRVLLRFLAKK